MTAKQTTWRKSSAWKTVGSVKRRTAAVQICTRGPSNVELHVFNRIFKFASPDDAKLWCETQDFVDTYDLLAAQWKDKATPAKSTQAALAAVSLGLGRACVSAPSTFLF